MGPGFESLPGQMQLNLQTKPQEYFHQKRPEMLEFIPITAEKILDIGCGAGIFGQDLKNKQQAEVWGIEFDTQAGQEARGNLDKVLIGDVNELINQLPDQYFDCIICNDILEHLVDPYGLLRKLKNKLAGTGVIACSLPNVRYLPNLINLCWKKQWHYEDQGILDKTHLRFFTQKSINEMFKDLDYKIIKLQGINPINSWKFKLLNFIFCNTIADTKFLQFACLVKPIKI